jgi:formylglycine-generating enzyme required for sulfatase activity
MDWPFSVGGAMSRYVGLVAVFVVVSSARAVTIATVPVGYAGNSPDPATGFGAVPYNYSIGTFDITNAQYVEFLNAKASAADPYGLWDMAMDPNNPVLQFEPGAIYRTGTGPYSYSVKPGFANKPVVNVSWFDAIRFVNWLQNGRGNGDTERGTYIILNGANNSGAVALPDVTVRIFWANTKSFHWLLPSENEWYKAAYYNGPVGSYFSYPFRESDSQPVGVAPPGNTNSGDFTAPHGAGVDYPAYNYDGNGSHLTDVGAYPNSLSPFGSYDMGGDVSQWNEATLRGGGWNNDPFNSGAATALVANSSSESNFFGFRVASVGGIPEPSTALLAALACGVIWLSRQRIARRRVLHNAAGI